MSPFEKGVVVIPNEAKRGLCPCFLTRRRPKKARSKRVFNSSLFGNSIVMSFRVLFFGAINPGAPFTVDSKDFSPRKNIGDYKPSVEMARWAYLGAFPDRRSFI